jgi:poly(A) polymerase
LNRLDLERRLERRTRRDPLLRGVREAAIDCEAPVWLVGGAVRGAALGRETQDLDLAAGRGVRRLVARLEVAWGRRGFRFRKRGVTTWRFAVGDRRIDLVDAARRGIRGDLNRRELTVNAIGFDLITFRVLDPFGGLRDVRARLLRLPRPGTIGEDPVRALRAARFLAELPRFRLHAAARREAREVGPRLGRASAERILEELDKLLMSPAPARGLRELEGLDLVRHVLPELVPLRACVAGWGRGSVWVHTLKALDRSARARGLPGAEALDRPEARKVLRWALLLHDIAKPETLAYLPDRRPTFHGHDALGARRAEALLRRLRAPRTLRHGVVRLVRLHLRPGHLADASVPQRGLRRLVHDAGEDLTLLVLHAACDAKAHASRDAMRRWSRLRRVLRSLVELHRRAAARPVPRLLTGTDVMRELGIPEGPEVGRLLRRVRELQERGELTSCEEALAFLRAAHGAAE